MKSKLTLADIAKITGLSTSTVSRALNDSPLINDDTKKYVQQVAQEHNYKLHLGARNFRLQKSFTVAVVIPIDASNEEILSNAFVQELIAVVATELRKYDYNLLLLHEVKLNEQYWASGLVDGFIQLGHGLGHTVIEDFPKDMPLVVWGPKHPEQSYISVGIDNISLSYEAVQHLINLGHRRIALLIGDYSNPRTEAFLRLQGYKKALESNGIAFDENLVGYAGLDAETGYKVAERLVKQQPDIEAIFVAAGDVIAIKAIEAAHNYGKRVPEDIAIVGFDNISMGEYSGIGLSTVSQEIKTSGAREMVENLMTQIQGEAVESKIIKGRLIIRQTCGSDLK